MKAARSLALVPLVALALVAGGVQPASAAQTARGAMTVGRYVGLPTFPCPSPAGCDGATASLHRGVLTGKHDNTSWTLDNRNTELVNPSARLRYTETCLRGTGRGQITEAPYFPNLDLGRYGGQKITRYILVSTFSYQRADRAFVFRELIDLKLRVGGVYRLVLDDYRVTAQVAAAAFTQPHPELCKPGKQEWGVHGVAIFT